MKTIKTLEIEIPVDGLVLSAFLHMPDVPAPPLVIGCHGLFADAESPKQKALAGALASKGIAFLRLDHRGCGKSGGDFKRDTTFPARLGDLKAARAAMKARGDLGGMVGLFGSSMGGAVCLSSAFNDPVAALCIYAAPAHFAPLAGVLRSSGDDKRLSPRFFAPENAFDLPDDPLETGPILVFHGDRDQVVPVAHGREIYERAAGPKSIEIFEGGDHPMNDPGHQALFLERATAFFNRYLNGL
ncbi:MAG: alpha/beta hydrolase [Deltaproteobacteria bacterium]|nr:alpha/beta hydrolase [Deltaproteobacteria bacterium]